MNDFPCCTQPRRAITGRHGEWTPMVQPDGHSYKAHNQVITAHVAARCNDLDDINHTPRRADR